MDLQKLSLTLNGVLLLVIIVLVAFGLKEGNFGGVSKESLERDYVKIDLYNNKVEDARNLQQQLFQKESQIYLLNERVKELEALLGQDGVQVAFDNRVLQCTFDDLSESEKKGFVTKNEFDALLKKFQALKSGTEDTYEPKTQKPLKVNKPIATLTCSHHLPGSYFIPKECKDEVLQFIKTHSNASRFNLIGIVDKQDFALVKGLKNSDEDILEKLGVNQFHIDQIEVIAPLGLARARAKEVMQLLKQKLGKDSKITQESYELILEDKRGFVLQAYE